MTKILTCPVCKHKVPKREDAKTCGKARCRKRIYRQEVKSREAALREILEIGQEIEAALQPSTRKWLLFVSDE